MIEHLAKYAMPIGVGAAGVNTLSAKEDRTPLLMELERDHEIAQTRLYKLIEQVRETADRVFGPAQATGVNVGATPSASAATSCAAESLRRGAGGIHNAITTLEYETNRLLGQLLG